MIEVVVEKFIHFNFLVQYKFSPGYQRFNSPGADEMGQQLAEKYLVLLQRMGQFPTSTSDGSQPRVTPVLRNATSFGPVMAIPGC